MQVKVVSSLHAYQHWAKVMSNISLFWLFEVLQYPLLIKAGVFHWQNDSKIQFAWVDYTLHSAINKGSLLNSTRCVHLAAVVSGFSPFIKYIFHPGSTALLHDVWNKQHLSGGLMENSAQFAVKRQCLLHESLVTSEIVRHAPIWWFEHLPS